MGQMLIAQADEIEAMLNAVDVRSLSVLVGNLEILGGGEPAKARPFVESKPKRSKKTLQNLTPEQKQQIREHYDKLDPKDQTVANRKTLAAAYGITPSQMGAVLFHREMGKAHAVRHAKAVPPTV